MRMVMSAGLGLLPDLQYIEQDQQIQDARNPEKSAGYTGADHSTDALQLWQFLFHSRCGECETDAKPEDHGGVSEGEEKAYAQRPFAVLQHEANRVIYRSDVVG